MRLFDVSSNCFCYCSVQSAAAVAAGKMSQNVTGAALPHRVAHRVNIQQYRPGYTWNRGGRLKELRIRYCNWPKSSSDYTAASQIKHLVAFCMHGAEWVCLLFVLVFVCRNMLGTLSTFCILKPVKEAMLICKIRMVAALSLCRLWIMWVFLFYNNRVCALKIYTVIFCQIL